MNTEKVLDIDSSNLLVGVYSEAGNKSPLILMFNVGLHTRTGPSRINVLLARGLLKCGYSSFRFDLSGHGDHHIGHAKPASVARSRKDLNQVMDYFQSEHGISSFIVIGLCSGAQLGQVVAESDKRIVGSIMIDPYTTRNSQFFPHYFKNKFRDLLRVQKIQSLLSKRQKSDSPVLEGGPLEFWNQFKDERAEIAASIQKTVGRGMPMMVVYTGGFSYYYSYFFQFHDMFEIDRGTTLVTVKWYRDADHLLSDPETQDNLLADIENWLQSNRKTFSRGGLS